MGLTGGTFITLTVILAVVVVAVCVRLLGTVPGRTLRDIGTRTGLILATQAATLFAVLVLVNSWGDFYATWGDLLGTDHSKGQLTGKVKDVGPTIAPLSRVTGHLRPAGGAGRVDEVTLGGPRTGLAAQAYIVLPPQYLAQPAHRFPAVLVLSADARTVATTLDPKTAPAVYVVTTPPQGGCIDIPGGAQAETFLAEDIPESVATGYRTDAEWGVLGDETYGYCAAKLTLRRSDRYPAGVALAAFYNPPAGNYYGGSPAMQNENTLAWRLQHRQPPPATLLLAPNPQSAQLAGLARPPLRIDLAAPGTSMISGLADLQRWLAERLAAVLGSPPPSTTASAPGPGPSAGPAGKPTGAKGPRRTS
jgi:hypothetical protein